jgi:predicted nuclease of predicted toxin-antitoxin system
MRIKLDENLPVTLVGKLAALGHDVDTVPAETLASRPDAEIWGAAQRTRRFLITQDLDFSDIRRFAPGTHHGLLLVRLGQPGRRALAARVRMIFEKEDVEGWHRCFVVATDRKIRVRRPRPSKSPPA